MKNFINRVSIQNFKSIKDLKKLKIPTRITEFKKLTSQKNIPQKFDDLIEALLTANSTRVEYLRKKLNEDIKKLRETLNKDTKDF